MCVCICSLVWCAYIYICISGEFPYRWNALCSAIHHCQFTHAKFSAGAAYTYCIIVQAKNHPQPTGLTFVYILYYYYILLYYYYSMDTCHKVWYRYKVSSYRSIKNYISKITICIYDILPGVHHYYKCSI